jgi:GNAT superfamily N-acetyltransferase
MILEHPRKLNRDDDCSSFTSGAAELDDWLRRFAWENSGAGNAVTFATAAVGQVFGFYALAMASYLSVDLPTKLTKNRPAQTPCVLLARLAVDRRVQSMGVGAALLKDSIIRTFQLSEQIGAAALLIHCRDDAAKAFYLANGDFLESPVNPQHLFLPLKEIRRRVTQ